MRGEFLHHDDMHASVISPSLLLHEKLPTGLHTRIPLKIIYNIASQYSVCDVTRCTVPLRAVPRLHNVT